MKKPNPTPAAVLEDSRQSWGPSIAVVSSRPAVPPAPRLTLPEEALPLASAVIRAAVATQDLQDALRVYVHHNGDTPATTALRRHLQAHLGPVESLALARTLLEEVSAWH